MTSKTAECITFSLAILAFFFTICYGCNQIEATVRKCMENGHTAQECKM